MVIKASVQINSQIDKVFSIFTDLNIAEKAIEGITKIEVIEGPAKMTVGTKWRETREIFGKEATEEMQVTSLLQNKSYFVTADSQGTKYSTEFLFNANGNNTDVEMIFEGIPYSFTAKLLSLLAGLFKGATQKMLQKDLEDLKKYCESN